MDIFETPPRQTKTFKRTKIIATIGPATHSYEAICQLITAGVNGFRLNFSHGSHEEHQQKIDWIRQASREYEKPVAILQDLQGPKIRLGELNDNHQEVKAGDELRLVYGGTHDGLTVPIQYDLSQHVKPGERLFLFDGRVRSLVAAVEDKSVMVRIENDGVLMSKKGVNLPDTDFSGAILTEKDYADIDAFVDKDIDYVCLSFVHRAHDIEVLRGYLAEKGSPAHIIAKVETKTAIEHEELEHIVEASDAVMVARGDLAVEVGAEIVPIVQRQIIALCQKHARISIVATQMMLNMVEHPEPTRAEVTDVSHATIIGADCVMLSDETAMGKYPIETVETMKRIILHTQASVSVRPLATPHSLTTYAEAISTAAVIMARNLHADVIVCETKTGATAQNIAAHRPMRPIVSVTSDLRVAQQLALLYANKVFWRPDGERAGEDLARELVRKKYFTTPILTVIVSGHVPGMPGGTDTVRIRMIDEGGTSK